MKTDKSKDSMAKDNYDALLADNLSSTVCHLDVEEIEASSSDSLWTKAQKIYEDGRNISTENVPYKILLRLQQYFDMTFIKKVVKEDGKTSQKINLDEQYPILQCIDRWRTDHKLITDYINERDYLISIGLSKLKGN
jgi:C1A family cysteine protease